MRVSFAFLFGSLIVAAYTSCVNAWVGRPCQYALYDCEQPQEDCINQVCNCSSGYYREQSDAANVACRAYRHAEICDHTKKIVCKTKDSKCFLANDGAAYRCLCSINAYHQPTSDTCPSVSDWAVTVTSTQVAATEITFTWNANFIDSPFNYTVTWSSGVGLIDYVNRTGGRLYELEPDKYYLLKLITIIPGNSYYSEKTASTKVPIRTKKIPYGDSCGIPRDIYHCNDYPTTECIQTPSSNGLRCLCADEYYLTPSNVCESLSLLAVTLTSAQSTPHTATFTWNLDNRGIPVNHTIAWSPRTGAIDYVNSTGARLYNLKPYTKHSVYLKTIVPGSSVYPEKTATTTVTVVTKPISYSDPCTTPGDSSSCDEDNTKCMQSPLSGSFRCLCDGSYFRSSSNACEPLYALAVKVTSIQITPRTASLTWDADNRGIPVTYKITWSRGVGSTDYVNGTGARLYNLQPDSRYEMKLITVVPEDSYYFEKTASTSVSIATAKIGHGEKCSTPDSSSICNDDYTKCIQTESSGGYRCLCDDKYFRNPSNACELLSDLKILDYSTSSTSTTVSFLWYTNKKGMPVTYTLEWDRPEGKVDYINETGGMVFGFLPDSSYTFTIGSVIPASGYYQEKEVTLTLPSLKTANMSGDIGQADHGEPCDASSETKQCRDDNQACSEISFNGDSRCLCQDGYYVSPDNTCRNLNELEVSNLKITRVNSGAADLTWTANRHGTSVSYYIQSSPEGVNVVEPVNEKGGQVTGLKEGVQYTFTVVSILPSYTYYTQQNVSVSVSVPSPGGETESKESVDVGIIAAIVAAVVVVVTLVVVSIVYCRRRRPQEARKRVYDQPNIFDIMGSDNASYFSITGQSQSVGEAAMDTSPSVTGTSMYLTPADPSPSIYDTAIDYDNRVDESGSRPVTQHAEGSVDESAGYLEIID